LPQFHPIPENDAWWGKGFTEWTNVGKAKPLFRGHNQPRVPADLGYYDLRVPETRIEQAELAKDAGIEGFCYWHYWFGNGKRLLERPFNEVLTSGKPDFPFCLAWANHSWKAKTWSPEGIDKVLIEQGYYGIQDYTDHFYEVLPAFLDQRYIRIKNKPMFLIWDPDDFGEISLFIKLWNELAKKNGLEGIHFVASATKINDVDKFVVKGFNSVSLDLLLKSFQHRNILIKSWFRLLRSLCGIPKYMDYDGYSKYLIKNMPVLPEIFPSIVPNFDHSPRSGKYMLVLKNDSPSKFGIFLKSLFEMISNKDPDTNIVILRSWNEWAEGNYLEPDLKFGRSYIEVLKKELSKINSNKL